MSSPKKFSIARFTLGVLAQVILLGIALRLTLPEFWQGQIEAGVVAFLGCFVGFHLFLSFFEWFFHRYVLHSVIASWLRRFPAEHRHHHSLTAIRLRPVADGSHRVILNEYPILVEKQFESAAFPAWSLLAFWALFTPLIVGLQLALPGLPMVLGGYAAIACSMLLYEVLHAIDHWPYEWWRKAIEHRRFGGMWKLVYGFHLMHHANIACNEAISGFFGLPVPDWCLGTYHQPRELLLEGRRATAEEFQIRRPWRFVRALDRWARRREAALQRR